ncbi:apoptosis-stimulating of p53 protein 1, partial [Striga asiatica]
MLHKKFKSPSNICKEKMQQLKAKLKEVKILAAMLSTHKGKHENASSEAEAFLPIFLQSYQERQTAELTIMSTGKTTSRSTTCAPSCSISRILWYVLLLEIIISSLKFRRGLQDKFCFDSKPT